MGDFQRREKRLNQRGGESCEFMSKEPREEKVTRNGMASCFRDAGKTELAACTAKDREFSDAGEEPQYRRLAAGSVSAATVVTQCGDDGEAVEATTVLT